VVYVGTEIKCWFGFFFLAG